MTADLDKSRDSTTCSNCHSTPGRSDLHCDRPERRTAPKAVGVVITVTGSSGHVFEGGDDLRWESHVLGSQTGSELFSCAGTDNRARDTGPVSDPQQGDFKWTHLQTFSGLGDCFDYAPGVLICISGHEIRESL